MIHCGVGTLPLCGSPSGIVVGLAWCWRWPSVGVGFDADDQVLDLDVGVAVELLEGLWHALLL